MGSVDSHADLVDALHVESITKELAVRSLIDDEVNELRDPIHEHLAGTLPRPSQA